MQTLSTEDAGFMTNELSFKTRTGYCYILSDKIVLTRNGIIGDMANLTIGNNPSRMLLIYSVLVVCLLYASFNALEKGIYGSAILFIGLSSFLVYGIIRSSYHSATPVIAIDKIIRVQFTNSGTAGINRAFFTIHFADERGRIKKRLIALPGAFYSKEEETVSALATMKSRFTVIER